MAQDRIVPQFDPTRIVQPTANPVDLYFRPVLAQPDVTQQLQVAKAFENMLPQLQRLSSDAMAFGIKQEKSAGVIEALNEPNAGAMLKKATQYIEKAGGLAPWRYQSYLETAGARLARDNYQAELYKQMDRLANPFKEDGTVQDPNFITEEMAKLYQAAGIPADSYYMNKGAAEAKANIDQAFLSRAMLIRADRVKTQTEIDLKDRVMYLLETTTAQDYDKLLAPGGVMETDLKVFNSKGYGDGRDIFAAAVKARSEALTAQGDFDEAKALVSSALNHRIGPETVGKGRFAAVLEAQLGDIEKARDAKDEHDEVMRARREATSSQHVLDDVRGQLQKRKAAAGDAFMPVSYGEAITMAEESVKRLNIDPSLRDAAVSRAVENIIGIANAMNSPRPDDPSVAANMAQQSLNLNPQNYQDFVDAGYAAVRSGNMSLSTWESIRGRAETNMEIVREVGQQLAQVGQVSGLNDVGWTGRSREAFGPDSAEKLAQIGQEAYLAAQQETYAEYPELAKKYAGNKAALASAMSSLFATKLRERKNQLMQEHGEFIKMADRTEGFQVTWGKISAQVEEFATAAVKSMSPDNEMDAYALRVELMNQIQRRFETAFETVNDKPDIERFRYLQSQMVPIIRETTIALRNNPAALDALTPEARNQIQGSMQQVLKPGATPTGEQPMAGVVAPPGSGDSPVQASTWTLFGKVALTPSESNVATLATSIRNANITPESSETAKASFDKSKAELQANAMEAIKALQSVSLRDYNIKLGKGWLGGGGDSPAFQIREDGLYVDQFNPLTWGPTNPPVLDKRATEQYWVYKSLVGYTPEELKAKRTAEGLTIGPAMSDPTTFLFFTSTEDFRKAADEYVKSGGTKGFIAETVFPMLPPGTAFDKFKEAQMRLLQVRKPR